MTTKVALEHRTSYTFDRPVRARRFEATGFTPGKLRVRTVLR